MAADDYEGLNLDQLHVAVLERDRHHIWIGQDGTRHIAHPMSCAIHRCLVLAHLTDLERGNTPR